MTIKSSTRACLGIKASIRSWFGMVPGAVEDIIVVESKFATKGGSPKLSKAGKERFQQLSDTWMDNQLALLEDHHPRIYQLLEANKDKIRFKANVLDSIGRNKWHDYGKYTPKSGNKEAMRSKK